MKKMLAIVKDVDVVIPGHSPMMTLKDVEEYARYTEELFTQTQAALKAGKTVEDAVKAVDLSAKFPSYKSERVPAAVTAVYNELKK
jgi:hypothetical protein